MESVNDRPDDRTDYLHPAVVADLHDVIQQLTTTLPNTSSVRHGQSVRIKYDDSAFAIATEYHGPGDIEYAEHLKQKYGYDTEGAGVVNYVGLMSDYGSVQSDVHVFILSNSRAIMILDFAADDTAALHSADSSSTYDFLNAFSCARQWYQFEHDSNSDSRPGRYQKHIALDLDDSTAEAIKAGLETFLIPNNVDDD